MGGDGEVTQVCNLYTCMTTGTYKKGCFLRMEENFKGFISTCFQEKGCFPLFCFKFSPVAFGQNHVFFGGGKGVKFDCY